MGSYRVPQDVEADDKLLGPFSFKQFIFLIVAVIGLGLAYALSRILLPLAIIPLPVAIFFAILALPLRKEQPMEVYVAAIISFILRPKVRTWQADGVEELVEVVAPKTDDEPQGKGYSQEEIQKRMSYLANIVDSQGWSLRGVEQPDSSMRQDLYNEAQAVIDPFDDHSQRIDNLLIKNDNQKRQELMNLMQQPQTTQPTPTSTVVGDENIQLTVNPYPKMSQTVISPLSQPPATNISAPVNENQLTETSLEQISPAIIDLASNHDGLSVETLQREAERIKQKEKQEAEQEVVISLR